MEKIDNLYFLLTKINLRLKGEQNMEEIEIKAIQKTIDAIEWQKDHWGKPPCDQCDRYPEVITQTTAENDSICGQCIEKEIIRKQNIEQRIQKWKNRLKGENNE